MSEFLRGVQLGSSIYDDVENEKRRKAQEARAAQEAQWKAEERSREQGFRQQWEQLAADQRDGMAPTVAVDDDGNQMPRIRLSDEQYEQRVGALKTARGDVEGARKARDAQRAAEQRRRYEDVGRTMAQLSDEEFFKRYAPTLNENMRVRGAVGYDPKTKRYVVSDYDGDGGVQYLTRAEVQDYVLQNEELKQGDLGAATKRGLGRDLRRRNFMREDVADNNTGMNTAHTMNDRDARFQLQRGQANEAVQAARLGRLIEGYTVGPDGQLVPSYTAITNGPRGVGTQSIPMPPNFVPARALDPQRVAAAAEELVGTPTGRTNPDGTAQAHTPETARQQVVGGITRAFTGRGDTGAPDVGAAAAAIRSRAGSVPARDQSTPPQPPYTSSGQRNFGVLTPESVILREAQAGNPHAIEYLRRRDEARAADQNYRGQFGYGG